jgi:hypothetical protein
LAGTFLDNPMSAERLAELSAAIAATEGWFAASGLPAAVAEAVDDLRAQMERNVTGGAAIHGALLRLVKTIGDASPGPGGPVAAMASLDVRD